MGLILLPLYAGYILVSIGLLMVVRRFTKSKVALFVTLTPIVLLPTYDILLTNILGYYYCATDSDVKTYIKTTVHFPESVYWEDNVYPGFGDKDRQLMIKSYLDGLKIKRIALNAPNGGVYEYCYENIPQEYIDLLVEYEKKRHVLKTKYINYKSIFEHREEHPDWKVTRAEYLALERTVSHDFAKLSGMKENLTLIERKISLKEAGLYRYIVRANMVPISTFSKYFVYADEVQIIDTQAEETIAKNRRYMRRIYNIFPSSGGYYYYQPSSSICGDAFQERFDMNVFDVKASYGKHSKILNFELNDRSKKGAL